MKQVTFLSISLFLSIWGTAQTSANVSFDDITIGTDTFLNGSDGATGHTSYGTYFPVTYDSTMNFWSSGVAISTRIDTAEGSYTNLYGAYSSSFSLDTYAVANLGGDSFAISTTFPTIVSPSYVSVDVTNTTYAYKSMLTGNAFAKKFGGQTGDDPDYFFIRFYSGNDSLDVYLADFRFEDNSEDYIIDDWTTIDLSELEFDSPDLSFKAFSSDTGAFGINTPLFFAFDNLKYTFSTGLESVSQANLKIWSDGTSLHTNNKVKTSITIFDINGKLLYRSMVSPNEPIVFPAQHRVVFVRSTSDHGSNVKKVFH